MANLLLLLALVQSPPFVQPFAAPTLELSPLPSGLFKKLGGFRPLGIRLSKAKPETVVKSPEGLLRYGVLTFGSRQVLVATSGDNLYVDSNSDGDLTNDPAPAWNLISATGAGKASRQGTFKVDLPVQGKIIPCEFGVYETGQPDSLGAYADFALVGKVHLGGKTYDTIYADPTGTWDGSQGLLMIDKDGNGKFHPGLEFYEAGKPFNVSGITYELRSQGGQPVLVKSTKFVEERTLANTAPADPNLANGLTSGKPTLPFVAKAMSGKTLSFPGSYKGKVVLLDFWATWCAPCMREMPNVVKAYETFHPKNFEVLGVSLDSEDAVKQIQGVTSKQKMKWEQVYEGQGFDAKLAKLYSIKAIPATYLVDGDTGQILAVGEETRGAKLEQAIKKALAAKK